MSYASESKKIIAQNKAAYHEYFVDEKIECGISLSGTEVKSIRAGKVNLKDSFAEISNGECFICNMHISPYEQGNIFNKDPLRKRKLLLHKNEIRKLFDEVRQKGITLVPLEIYFTKGKVKLLLATAKGKKLYDKRDAAAERDTKREIDRKIKEL